MKKKTIDCTVDIWDTEYTMRDYGDRIILTVPITVWRNNSGTLNFQKIKLTKKTTMDIIRKMFDDQTLIYDECFIIDDVIYGNIVT